MGATSQTAADPLGDIFPEPADRAAWHRTGGGRGIDTDEDVVTYEHIGTGRKLHLGLDGRVYGQDPEGAHRVFGRGGHLALKIALNVVFDGFESHRPSRIVLPQR